MPFCSKCGSEIAENAMFCSKCGEPVAGGGARRVESFVGEIRKCPNCGAVINDFTAVCPECGAQLNNGRVSEAIKEFTTRLVSLDAEIADEKARKIRDAKNSKTSSGWWSSWSGKKKFGYVVLNYCLLCIPLIGHLLVAGVKLIAPKSQEKNFSAASMKKKSHIENFVVPNTKDDVMEFLTFSQSQLSSIGKKYENADYWKSAWADKIDQIINKSKPLFAADPHFVKYLDQQKAVVDETRASLKKKTVAIFVSIVVVVVVVVLALSLFLRWRLAR